MNILEKIKTFYNNYKAYIKSLLLILVYVIISFSIYFLAPSVYDKYSTYTNIIFTIGGLALFTHILIKHYNLGLRGITFENGMKLEFKILYKKWLLFVGLLVGLFVIGYGLIYLSNKSKLFTETMTLLLNIIGILLVLGLSYLLIEKMPIFRKVKEFIYKSQITKILYHFIFYIPCLLGDIINYIKNLETEKVPTYVYYILGFEILFVIGYFMIPKLINMMFTSGGKQLLNKPIYLNKQAIHATYEELNGDKVKENEFNYSYGLSTWFFIHNQSGAIDKNTNDYISILNYGDKPNILYNQQENKLKVVVETELQDDDDEEINIKETIYDLDYVPLQKWNNIVINYNSGLIDIFINGNLVATKKTGIPYMTMDSIISGSEGGISGGICNIMYYNEPISKSKIEFLYNNLKTKQSPHI
jgi:hypothetical protein